MKAFWKQVAKPVHEAPVVCHRLSSAPQYLIEGGDLFEVMPDNMRYVGPVPRELLKALGKL